MLEVEGGRREVLKQTTGEVKGLGTLREGCDWQQSQRQHGRGASGADIPLEMAPLGKPARPEDQLSRANYPSLKRPVAQLGHRFHRLQVLGPEPGRVASGPDMGQVYVLASEGCQWHPKAHNGPSPGKTAAIEVKHSSGGLLAPTAQSNCGTRRRSAIGTEGAAGKGGSVAGSAASPNRRCTSWSSSVDRASDCT